MVSKDPRLFPELIAGLWSEDALVRMRAADATEKVTRRERELLRPYKTELLGLAIEAKEQELRWHLAVMVPRLLLNAKERQLATSLLNSIWTTAVPLSRPALFRGWPTWRRMTLAFDRVWWRFYARLVEAVRRR